MSLIDLLFGVFALLAAFGALAILFSRNVFKSAMYLLVTLLSIAALYVLTYAEFLAVTQILIYAGGITILIIFGIMLTTRITGQPLVVRNTHILSGSLAAIALFIVLIKFISPLAPVQCTMGPTHIGHIGLQIFSTYSLPFEVAGVLLLISLVGAAVVASHLKSKV